VAGRAGWSNTAYVIAGRANSEEPLATAAEPLTADGEIGPGWPVSGNVRCGAKFGRYWK
jgi:hypothetical protein